MCWGRSSASPRPTYRPSPPEAAPGVEITRYTPNEIVLTVTAADPGWLVLAEHLTLTQGLAIALVMAASMGTAWTAGQDKRVTPGSGQA